MVTSQSNDPPAPPGVSAAGRAATAGGGAPPLAPPGCDVVTVPARQGLEAVDILRRGAGDAVGPVLHDGGGDTLGFLVPPGTAAAWDVPGSTCTETDGRGLRPSPEPPRWSARTGCCLEDDTGLDSCAAASAAATGRARGGV
ncbi:hypothetical protein SGRIM128S_06786 [Streptomyces griseomycini]